MKLYIENKYEVNSMNNPLKAVIVGGGHRSMIYAGLAKTNPEMLKIVGVVDPNEFRRNQIGEYFDIPSEYREEQSQPFCLHRAPLQGEVPQ